VITLDDVFLCCDVVWTFGLCRDKLVTKSRLWGFAIQIVTTFPIFYLVRKAEISVLGLVLPWFLQDKSLALALGLNVPCRCHRMVNFLFSVQYFKCRCTNVVF